MPRLISMKKIISIHAQHVSHGSYTKKQNSRFMLHLSSQSQKKEYVNQLESLILMQLRDHHFSSARNALNVETVYCSRTCNLGENDQTNPGKKTPTQVVCDCKPPQRRHWSLNPIKGLWFQLSMVFLFRIILCFLSSSFSGPETINTSLNPLHKRSLPENDLIRVISVKPGKVTTFLRLTMFWWCSFSSPDQSRTQIPSSTLAAVSCNTKRHRFMRFATAIS